MVKQIIAGTVAVTSLVGASIADAAAISGTVERVLAWHTYDLDAGTDDWAVYGRMGYGSGDVTDFTYKSGVGSFSALTVDQGTAYLQNWGPVKFMYGASAGTYGSATGMPANALDYANDICPVVPDNNGVGSQLSFTHTMLGTDETLQIYVMTKVYADNPVSIQAVLQRGDSSPVTAASYAELATLPNALDGQGGDAGDFGKGAMGVVTLSVSDANIGDVLTFTVAENRTAATQNWWGVGIAGATATVAVPEPASMGVLAGAVGLLLSRRRRNA